MTPQHLVISARALLPAILAALVGAIWLLDCSPAVAGSMTFAAALVLMQAAPRMRAADLLAGLCTFVTLLEWAHAAGPDGIDMVRWLNCVAVCGGIVLLLKVQHMRGLARQDAYVPLRQLERRTALLGRTASRAKGTAIRRAS